MKYIKVTVNAVLELVITDEKDFEESVQAKVDDGDFEVLSHDTADFNTIEDWDHEDLKREYQLELKREEMEEMRRLNETV